MYHLKISRSTYYRNIVAGGTAIGILHGNDIRATRQVLNGVDWAIGSSKAFYFTYPADLVRPRSVRNTNCNRAVITTIPIGSRQVDVDAGIAYAGNGRNGTTVGVR